MIGLPAFRTATPPTPPPPMPAPTCRGGAVAGHDAVQHAERADEQEPAGGCCTEPWLLNLGVAAAPCVGRAGTDSSGTGMQARLLNSRFAPVAQPGLLWQRCSHHHGAGVDATQDCLPCMLGGRQAWSRCCPNNALRHQSERCCCQFHPTLKCVYERCWRWLPNGGGGGGA